MMSRNSLLVLLMAGCALAVEVEDVVGSRNNEKASELVEEAGDGKLYFTGPGYTINLIPQALLLGLLSFLAVYFLGLDLFGTSTTSTGSYGAPTGYGAPEPSYGAPSPSYGAPSTGYDAPSSSYSASGRYYDTYSQASADSLNGYENDSRRKRSSF